MNAKSVVTAAAMGVGGVAMYGSAAALYEVGVHDHLAAPWTLPFALDALALVCVGAWIFAGLRTWSVRLGPVLGYGLSGIFQIWAVWGTGRPVLSHVAPLAAAILLSEVAMKIWAPTETVTASETLEESEMPTVPAPSSRPPAADLEQLVSRAVSEDAPRTISGLKRHLGVGDSKARAVLSQLELQDIPRDARPETVETQDGNLALVRD